MATSITRRSVMRAGLGAAALGVVNVGAAGTAAADDLTANEVAAAAIPMYYGATKAVVQARTDFEPAKYWSWYCESVRHLQAYINRHGGTLSVDGVFGPATRRHVIAIQAHYGLTRDGVVGDRTIQAMGMTVASNVW